MKHLADDIIFIKHLITLLINAAKYLTKSFDDYSVI